MAMASSTRRKHVVLFLAFAVSVAVMLAPPLAAVTAGSAPAAGPSGASVNMGALALCAVMGAYYVLCWHDAKVAGAREAKEAEDMSTETKKKPRIGALDSLRFILIAYIASGHFIHTATRNPFLLRLISQINVVVGAFFVISGYVAAYTTTELGQRKGSKRLDNAVEFVITRIMGHWPLHIVVLLLFSPVFLFVDISYSGVATAAWNGFISIFMLQAWFPTSAEVWNAPTWFLSALSFSLCALPYGLRILAGQKKEELRRTLVILTLLSLVPKVAYSNDLHAWGIMEGMLNAKTHPNYALFNSIRFSPLGALLEVLMGAVACRLVMLDKPQEQVKSPSSLAPLLAMLGVLGLRATGAVQLNDMLTRSAIFIPLWIVFLMRIHRESAAPGGSKLLPNFFCRQPLVFLGGISFPIFIVHQPIGQIFYKKAVASAIFGHNLASPQPNGLHWFFGVYWIIVLCVAYLLQKLFLESSRVQNASKSMVTFLINKLGGS